jgi:glycosyltransferase involved in cell wall biosynthesis
VEKLRIATFVTSHFTIPGPKGIIYAPLDVASELCTRLARRGHRVDFFAPRSSRVPGCRVVNLGILPLEQKFRKLFGKEIFDESTAQKIYNLWDQYFLSEIYKRALAGRYDLIHIHPIDRAIPFARTFSAIPTVYTLHDPIDRWRAKMFEMYKTANQHLVSISNAQRNSAPDLKYARTIYNGVDTDLFKFSRRRGEHLLFVGRLIEKKGVFEAIQAARKTGSYLYITGSPSSGEYWDQKIKPFLNDKIKYIGNIQRNKLPAYYSAAKVVLFPVRWEEPFGLVMIEAMACGTPVIAFRRGSVPEVIQDGKTGFVVNTVQEMAAAIKKLM